MDPMALSYSFDRVIFRGPRVSMSVRQCAASSVEIVSQSSNYGFEGRDRGGFVEGGAVHVGGDGVAGEEFSGEGWRVTV